jgi:LCP family protein required for cell wall assembly
MFRVPGKQVLAAKAGYVAACAAAALVLVTSGIAYGVESKLGSIGGSDALSGGPQTGAMNILLMGLESRTDYQGNVLSSQLLTAMHAGNRNSVAAHQVGGQDTNTLILIHIFAGGQKAVGFSIPRNDFVNFPHKYDGQGRGMIDQAYGLAYDQSLSQTINQSGVSSSQRYLQANEAGQKAAIDTVEAVTGQKVDHFAEANLAGFFELAQSFGGIEVCLKPWNGGQNLRDYNSGFNQKKAGYHHLAADQALAFVRERDNLPNGDLDRTRRQQAVVDYVIWKLEHQGVFTDAGQLSSLMDVAKQYLITDQDWNLFDFASDMKALTGKNLQFETLPIKGYATIYPGGSAEDINTVDVASIQSEIKGAFNGKPAPASKGGGPGGSARPASKHKTAPSYSPSDTVVDVYNAGQGAGIAGQVMQGLVAKGYKQGQTGNATTQSATQVLYGQGAAAAANAAKIASIFGVKAQASSAVSTGAVEVVLGSGSSIPGSLTGGSPSAAPSAQASLPSDATSVQAATANNGTNAPLKVSGNARFGIPCVY